MRRLLLLTLVLSLVAAACGEVDTGVIPGSGSVEANGATFEFECGGEGAPVVLLVDGVHLDILRPEEGFPTYPHAFEDLVELTTVCRYYTRGYRGSTPVAMGETQTAASQVDDLHAMIEAAGWNGPFVLVGASWSALNVLLFADEHPDLVSGIVLIDPVTPSMASNRFAISYPSYIDTVASAEQVAGITDLGDLPLALVNALDPRMGPIEFEPPETASHRIEFEAAEDDERKVLLDYSTNTFYLELEDSGHAVEWDRPDAYVESVRFVLDEVG